MSHILLLLYININTNYSISWELFFNHLLQLLIEYVNFQKIGPVTIIHVYNNM